jgi:hypothetical protein
LDYLGVKIREKEKIGFLGIWVVLVKWEGISGVVLN